jgi:hypothetical protein
MPVNSSTSVSGWSVALLLGSLLTGCALRPAEEASLETLSGDCTAWFAAAERQVGKAGVRDVQAARVQGHPHLRVDRLLAALASERPDGAAYRAWVTRAADLARQGWSVELANLPHDARAALVAPGERMALETRLGACLAELAAVTRDDAAGRDALLARAVVPDAYVDWQRAVGLYPLTRYAVLAGYFRWRDALDAGYAEPLAALPVRGELRRYASPYAGDPIRQSAWERDALGYPRFDAAAREVLFAAHAPLWEIDTVDGNDLPGAPRWPAGGWRASVDTARPVTYRHLSYTRVADAILPQLNYLLWFPARPPEGEGDIYAGHLDGLLLRVTLDASGRPLLYDTIHPCGCYHMFFPGPRLVPRPDDETVGEGFHVPQRAPGIGPGQRLAVRVAAGTHQLLRLHAVPATTPATPLEVRDYADLRSLARDDGRRSLFGEDALVVGTGRSERFLLWPMGVASAGAMRQWGRHATAFVGRRHFDDPGLIEAGFSVAPAGE